MEADVVEQITKQRGRCRVTLRSGQFFVLPKVMFRMFPLKVGEEIDRSAYLQRVRQAEKPEAMKRAAWLLGNRDYSAQLLREKLVDAGFGEQASHEVVAYLEDARYIDDARYAENLVSRRKTKHGTQRIARELQQKGIDEHVREGALEQLTEEEEAQQAMLLLQKYLRGKNLEPQDAFRRCIAYLARRGYSYEIAKRAYVAVTDDKDSE